VRRGCNPGASKLALAGRPPAGAVAGRRHAGRRAQRRGCCRPRRRGRDGV